MAKIYEDLTKLVGHTPLVELGHVEKAENLKARLDTLINITTS